VKHLTKVESLEHHLSKSELNAIEKKQKQIILIEIVILQRPFTFFLVRYK